VIPVLVKVLEDPDFSVRGRTVEALGKIGSAAVIPVLVKALEDPDDYVRWSAVDTLGKIGSDAVIPGLVKALEDPRYYVRWRAAEALGKIGSAAGIPGLVKALEDQYSGVHWRAAEALGNIGSAAAIPGLVKALEDQTSDVRRMAVAALGKIGSEVIIPGLVKALEDENFVQSNNGDTFEKVTQALQTIQEKLKLYNPTMTKLIQPIASQVTQLMYILHLSDLHITTPEQANLWHTQLAADLYNDLNLPQLDALILSGDIANYSTEAEYQAANQFLDNFRRDFPLQPEQIILVPGNHDLNWKLAKKAYQLIDRDEYNGELKEGSYIKESASVIRVRDEAAYQQRFTYFSQFYETIKGQPYPLEYHQQATLDYLKEQNLLILGLNSAWQLDHHYTSRAGINMEALSEALTEIRRTSDYRHCLKIAVWHHPLDSTGEDRITDQGFLEQLAVNGFRFFLHGHIHKAETSLFRYDMSSDGRKLDRICAGTFGAPVREWVPGYPLQYNLLKLEGETLRVRTRRREELNGSWKPDARWLQGGGQMPLDYYAIAL
jgi:3',5'-cyclic AMP phosphodiesterase CpdA